MANDHHDHQCDQRFVSIMLRLSLLVPSVVLAASLEIRHHDVSEDQRDAAFVTCSVSIIRSTFKLAEPLAQTSNNNNNNPSGGLAPRTDATSNLAGTEYLPRLDLFLSTRTPSSTLPNTKSYNTTLNDHILTRYITLQRPLTRADHNGTVQCQVESNTNMDVYLIKTVPVNIQCRSSQFSLRRSNQHISLFLFHSFRWSRIRSWHSAHCEYTK